MLISGFRVIIPLGLYLKEMKCPLSIVALGNR